MASHASVTNPAWVNIAPISSSINVGTDRIGSALARNVIVSNRVLGIVVYPLFPIAAPEVWVNLSSEGRAFSAEKHMGCIHFNFSAEKARLPPICNDVNGFLHFLMFF